MKTILFALGALASSSVIASDYFPLTEGNFWAYETSDGSSMQMAVGAETEFRGERGYPIQGVTQGRGFRYEWLQMLREDGADTYFAMPAHSNQWVLIRSGDPVDGAEFSYRFMGQNYSYRYERTECPAVPAVQATDCFLMRQLNISVPSYSIIARGIGSIYSVAGNQVSKLVRYEIR